MDSERGRASAGAAGRMEGSGRRVGARLLFGALSVAIGIGGVAPAAAQTNDGLLLTELPPDYDRGRNVSVAERPRPDYNAIGIRAGSFEIFPRLDIGAGATNNAFLLDDNRRGDAFVLVAPQISARSDWSRHRVVARAAGRFQRYLDETPLNQSAFDLNLLGELEASTTATLGAELRYSRIFESPFSGAIRSDLSVLSRYNRFFARASGRYALGRVRGTVALDHTVFDFEDIEIPGAPDIDQSDRDRDITRVIGTGEYAFSPSASIYAQLTYDHTDYSRPLFTGAPNRDADGVRLVAGLSMDLSNLVRGIIAAGYSRRDYDAAIYDDVDGLSVQSRLEYFYSPLTTFTLSAERTISDSNFGQTNAFFDNRVTIGVDHELLRNVIVNAAVDYAHQTYIGNDRRNDIVRASAGARYLVSPSYSLDGALSFGRRTSNRADFGPEYNEFRALVTLRIQR